MDPPLIQESSFSAVNPSAYSLTEICPFSGNPGNGGLGLRIGNLGQFVETRGGSVEESTVTEHSGGRKRKEESSDMVSTNSADDLNNNSNGKRAKVSGSSDQNGASKSEVEESCANGSKTAEQSSAKSPEPPKQDYIHVRARRGQATDSHSLAERARREKISERMKTLQELVPCCNKVIGKALVLDEIINYIQSLQRQVEFLSMKLEAVNSRMNVTPTIEGFPPKDLGPPPFDAAAASAMLFGSQATREYMQQSQSEWLHMQIGG